MISGLTLLNVLEMVVTGLGVSLTRLGLGYEVGNAPQLYRNIEPAWVFGNFFLNKDVFFFKIRDSLYHVVFIFDNII